ncbi:hypothetical protein EYF80_061006 [Liparis tanakae]|uniref:Uncharacterized protein n=1 Tax=Liparis tanakae TaxID=230148 RepID=A0A4Z2EJ05_9TELE|nr:hypothetical protein EYF80_061006 [Liparis tanakae]
MQVKNIFLGFGISEVFEIWTNLYFFCCLFKIHMEMLGVSSYEPRIHLISKRTTKYQRNVKEGNTFSTWIQSECLQCDPKCPKPQRDTECPKHQRDTECPKHQRNPEYSKPWCFLRCEQPQ